MLVKCIHGIGNQIIKDNIYLVVEIYIHQAKKNTEFRVIDSEGYPAIYDYSNFIIISNKLSDFTFSVQNGRVVLSHNFIFNSKLNSQHVDGFWGMFIDDNPEAQELLKQVIQELANMEHFTVDNLDF